MEKMQINMIFAVALHILYICVSSQLVVVIGGGGGTPLLHDCQDHCNSDTS